MPRIILIINILIFFHINFLESRSLLIIYNLRYEGQVLNKVSDKGVFMTKFFQNENIHDQPDKQSYLTRQNLAFIFKKNKMDWGQNEMVPGPMAFFAEQAENPENTQHLPNGDEKGNNKETIVNNLELLAQQKENFYLGMLSLFLLGSYGVLFYFYKALNVQNKIIKQQNELSEQTLAVLSHDIKEPLLGVKFLLKKLNINDPYLAQASQSLEKQINSVNRILDNLLKMKKLSLSETEKGIETNVRSVVGNVIEELNTAVVEKHLTIEIELPDDCVLPIAKEKLQIVVHNLLSNAVKYSFPNQKICIYKEDNGFCIQDFGIGLSADQHITLMQEVKASNQGTRQESGNGLGLFLVGLILQGEKIRVIFESPEVGGTIVKVLA